MFFLPGFLACTNCNLQYTAKGTWHTQYSNSPLKPDIISDNLPLLFHRKKTDTFLLFLILIFSIKEITVKSFFLFLGFGTFDENSQITTPHHTRWISFLWLIDMRMRIKKKLENMSADTPHHMKKRKKNKFFRRVYVNACELRIKCQTARKYLLQDCLCSSQAAMLW